MANYTEHYNLAMPTAEDFYDVALLNENFDTIDGLLAETAAETQSVSEKIGSAADDAQTDTVFGRLNQIAQGSTAAAFTGIKSFQTAILSFSTSKGSASATINEVDPAKCIVLMDRIYDSSSMEANISYTLEATEVSASSSSSVNGSIKLQFQIIELM